MIEKSALIKECRQLGIELTEEQATQFDDYAEELMVWSEKMNLTAIKKPEEIVTKHFVDSLTVLQVLPVNKKGLRVIDVGTGAGFPSVPMKILNQDLKVTLLDSLQKRLTFLEALSKRLGQENEFVHARAEEGGQNAAYREKFDIATARAVAHLRELAEYCLPYVKVGGIFVALKSGDIGGEQEEAKKAIQQMGGKIAEVRQLTLPDGSGRSLVVIKKISQTPTKYPRSNAKITKNPII